MKSNEILVFSSGKGFESAAAEAAKVAEYEHLPARDALHLQLITEEMLSLIRSVTGDLQASFWIENEGLQYILHLKTKTALNTVTAPELEAELKSALNGVENLILDFSALDYISSAGLRVLLSAHKTMTGKGKMTIRNTNEIVREVFDVTGFADILNIE